MRSRLPSAREAEIIEIAEAVADFYCPGQEICPLKIMKADDVKIDHAVGAYGETTFEGMLEYQNGRFFIFCNKDRGNSPRLPRGRFTLAHELGHFFIPEHRLALERGAPKHQSKCGLFDGQNIPEELEADIFAANLLMPPSRFNAAIAKCKAKTPLLKIIALKDQFKTSILSTAVQFASRAPDVVAMLKWNDDALGWKRVQNEYFAKHRFCSWKPDSPADLLKGSATMDALADLPDGKQSLVRESASSAATWFKNVPSSATKDLILREEALRLGDHGVLTLLSIHPQFLEPVSKRW